MASSWRAFSDLRDPRGSGTARYIRIKTCHVHGYRANANFNAMGSSLLWLLTINTLSNRDDVMQRGAPLNGRYWEIKQHWAIKPTSVPTSNIALLYKV
ncbi:unnamed protein product [Penicillium manginii]